MENLDQDRIILKPENLPIVQLKDFSNNNNNKIDKK